MIHSLGSRRKLFAYKKLIKNDVLQDQKFSIQKQMFMVNLTLEKRISSDKFQNSIVKDIFNFTAYLKITNLISNFY